MANLREQLEGFFKGRVCLMGLGNPDHGDDGFGIRLAEALARTRAFDVIVAGTAPERFLGRIAAAPYDRVIFLDAVDFGGAPGSAVLLGSDAMISRYPQISTHGISLGTLAKWAEADGRTQAWLLGVQPASLKPGSELSPSVRRTLEMLTDLFSELSDVGLAGRLATGDQRRICQLSAGTVVRLAALKGTRSSHPSAFAPGLKPSSRSALRRRAVRGRVGDASLPSPVHRRSGDAPGERMSTIPG